ncbi:MAG: stage II sporulation protein R [Clostridia bacterium]|nr:stage II sporulation protein R [Clostridia bacterium]
MSKRLYVAIVILLIVMMAMSFLPVHGEQEVYDTVVRLHVLANSDREEDQALKMEVRDTVLEAAAPYLEGCTTQEEAIQSLTLHLSDLEAVAAETVTAEGYDYPVTVLLGEEDYPTRTYESCAFPAGTYVSLRVCIGDAEGQNWWCCLFPPLCLSAATAKSENEDAFIQVGLTKDQYGIITETEKTKYKVRFKILEVIENWFW